MLYVSGTQWGDRDRYDLNDSYIADYQLQQIKKAEVSHFTLLLCSVIVEEAEKPLAVDVQTQKLLTPAPRKLSAEWPSWKNINDIPIFPWVMYIFSIAI